MPEAYQDWLERVHTLFVMEGVEIPQGFDLYSLWQQGLQPEDVLLSVLNS